MNKRKNESGTTTRNDYLEATRREERKGAHETGLGDLEPRAEIKGGSFPGTYTVTDVTLKRGSGG